MPPNNYQISEGRKVSAQQLAELGNAPLGTFLSTYDPKLHAIRETRKSLIPGIEEDVVKNNQKSRKASQRQILDYYTSSNKEIPASIFWYERASDGDDLHLLSPETKKSLKDIYGVDELSKLKPQDLKQLSSSVMGTIPTDLRNNIQSAINNYNYQALSNYVKANPRYFTDIPYLADNLSFGDDQALAALQKKIEVKEAIELLRKDFSHEYKEDGTKKVIGRQNDLNENLSDTLTALSLAKINPNLKPRLLGKLASDVGDAGLLARIPSLKKDYVRIPATGATLSVPLSVSFDDKGHLRSQNEIDQKLSSTLGQPLNKAHIGNIQGLVSHTHPFLQPAGHELADPEKRARAFLASKGVFPGTAEYAQKYIPIDPNKAGEALPIPDDEIKRIIARGVPDQPTIGETAQYVNALEQVRSKAPYFERHPTYVHTEHIDPNQYQGKLLAPVDEATKEGFNKGKELRDLTTAIEKARSDRFTPLKDGILKNNDAFVKIQEKVNPALESILSSIKSQADKIKGQEESFLDSKDYKHAQEIAKSNFDYLKASKDQEYQDKLARLRGRFMSHGGLQTSYAKAAESKLEREHRMEVDNLKFQLRDRAESLALQTFDRRRIINSEAFNTLQKAKEAHEQYYKHHQSERDDLNKQSAINEDFLKKREEESIAQKQALTSSFHGEGQHKHTLAQRELQAQQDAFNNSPGGALAQQRIIQAQQAANNTQTMPVPIPQASYPPVTMPNSSAMTATFASNIGSNLRDIFNSNPNVPQEQQAQQIKNFAEGGRARRSRDDAAKVLEEQMFHKFMAEKMRHEQQPTPALDPAWRTVNETAAALGNMGGHHPTYLGSVANAMVKGDEHKENYLKTKYGQSKERVDMQKTLSELSNKMREGEFRDNTLEQKYEDMDLTEMLKKLELAQMAALKGNEINAARSLAEYKAKEERSLEEFKGLKQKELEELKNVGKLDVEKYKGGVNPTVIKARNEARDEFKSSVNLLADASVAEVLSPYYSYNILPDSWQGQGKQAFDDFAKNTNQAYKKVTGIDVPDDAGLSGFQSGDVNSSITAQFRSHASDKASSSLEAYLSLDRNGKVEDFMEDASKEHEIKIKEIVDKVNKLGKARGLSEKEIKHNTMIAIERFDEVYNDSIKKALLRKQKMGDVM